MVTISGKTVSDGVVIGKISFLNKNKAEVSASRSENPASELERYSSAAAAVSANLERLARETEEIAGRESAAIFEIHRMMLSDKDFVGETERMIEEGWAAEYAVEQTAQKFSEIFSAMEDSYMRGRAADILDVAEQLIKALADKSQGLDEAEISSGEGVIICADDLAPSETVRMDKSKVLAIAIRYGSAQSHTAILARMMNIPAIIGLGDALSEDYDGMTAVADGSGGCIHIDPTPEVLEDARERSRDAGEKRERLRRLKGMENITIDGHRVMVYANIGTPDDVDSVLENDAGGIGLFRSEFLYLGRNSFPSEEEQFSAYKRVLKKMNGKKVVIRTLDIGADKNIDYFNIDKEENPALGYRAIRICLSQRDIFKVQLRALLRASEFGKLSIMVPMVISVDEVRQTRMIINEVKTQLRAEHIPFDDAVEFGIMIETPAAVMISDLLAREVDFFSIGTNDLTQYCLAIDRQNQSLEPYYDSHHTAVLRMIKKTINNAHRARIWCGICGELAADAEMTEVFLAMGVDELSVAPPHILPLRERIRATDVDKIRANVLGGI